MFSSRIRALTSVNTVALLALCSFLLLAGCEKKAARTTPPVLVPSIEAQPQPVPAPENTSNEDSTPAPEPATATTQQDAQKPKPKPRKPVPRKPTQPIAEQPKPEPAKPTAPDNSVQITADVPRAAVLTQKQNTEQLLRSSDSKLSHINRNLGDSEQGMLRQARNYMTQSNQALQSGDIQRAYNLAVKANLLANELAK